MDESRPSVEVGDVLLTPYGEGSIVEIVATTDMVLTKMPSGVVLSWRSGDIETMPQPDMQDLAQVERWLRCTACVVPGVAVETKTLRCNTLEDPLGMVSPPCSCLGCHTVIRKITRLGADPHGNSGRTETEVQHMVDNPRCSCVTTACPCTRRLSWMSAL